MKLDSYYTRSEVGTLFGIPPHELTDEQIKKVATRKLMEFLETDMRVESILAERLSQASETKDVEVFSCLEKQDWEKFTLIRKTYNEVLDRPDIQERLEQYSYYRSHHIFWNGLDDEHKTAEMKKYVAGRDSIIHSDNIDFTWLSTKDLDVTRSLAARIFDEYGSRGVDNLLRNVSAEVLIEFKPNIDKRHKDIRLSLLANPNTPEEWLDELLRIYAKKQSYRLPSIRRPLPNAVISKLPTVTRLEMLENLVGGEVGDTLKSVLFEVSTPEQFSELIFGAVARYYGRVESVTKLYKNKTQNEKESA